MTSNGIDTSETSMPFDTELERRQFLCVILHLLDCLCDGLRIWATPHDTPAAYQARWDTGWAAHSPIACSLTVSLLPSVYIQQRSWQHLEDTKLSWLAARLLILLTFQAWYFTSSIAVEVFMVQTCSYMVLLVAHLWKENMKEMEFQETLASLMTPTKVFFLLRYCNMY